MRKPAVDDKLLRRSRLVWQGQDDTIHTVNPDTSPYPPQIPSPLAVSSQPPLVSVIIPTFNVAGFIGETLDSVIRQRGVDALEVLVVDDRSDDDTAARVLRYVQTDSRVRLVANAGKKGAAGARNFGLSLVQGTWVAFLDGDDLWEPDNLALKLLAAHRYPDASLISSDFYNENRFNTTLLRSEWPQTRQSLLPVWRKNLPIDNGSMEPLTITNLPVKFIADEVLGNTGTFMTRRSLLLSVGGFDETLEVGEDVHLWIRLAMRLDHMLYLPQALMYYRHRPGSLTNQDYPANAFFATRFFKQMLASPEFLEHRKIIRQRIAKSSLSKTYYFRKKRLRWGAMMSAVDGLRHDWGLAESWKNLAAALLLK